MSLMDITAESLTRQLDREVPPVYVIIAKHSVLGMDEESIREVIGCDKEELAEVLNDPIYREVRLFIGAAHSQSVVDQTTGWDHLEGKALTNLLRRVEHERDPEFLLRVAAVANKAQRRHQAGKDEGVLDPTKGRAARITLTTRLIQSVNRAGRETETIERELSITDGSVKNPSFDDVNELLNVTATPALPRQVEIKTATPSITVDELDKDMQERFG